MENERNLTDQERLIVQMLLNRDTKAESIEAWLRMNKIEPDSVKELLKYTAERTNTKAQAMRETAKWLENSVMKTLRVIEMLTDIPTSPKADGNSGKTLRYAIAEYLESNPRKLKQTSLRTYKGDFYRILSKLEEIDKPITELEQRDYKRMYAKIGEMTLSVSTMNRCTALIHAVTGVEFESAGNEPKQKAKLIDTVEAAKMLGCSKDTARKIGAKIGAAHIIGSRYKYDPKVIRDYVRETKIKTCP